MSYETEKHTFQTLDDLYHILDQMSEVERVNFTALSGYHMGLELETHPFDDLHAVFMITHAPRFTCTIEHDDGRVEVLDMTESAYKAEVGRSSWDDRLILADPLTGDVLHINYGDRET